MNEKTYILKLEKDKGENNKPRRKMQTTKLIIIYLMMLLNAIIVYACVAMWHFRDLSYLQALITDIAAQVLIFAIYCAKAYFETKQEELTKIERERICKQLSEKEI